ncbi:MAG: arginine repressor [Oscillospiraceae bacterium]|jgi:transcriptional regulator of arginine metabolism|nr:arginine repressor [Oscillospiraceae bacterium]
MKITRQAKILDLISLYDIDTQEDLIRLLKQEGYMATQATISRDIKALGLQKAVASDGKYKYVAGVKAPPDELQNYRDIIAGAVIFAEQANNIVVIKTGIGMAQAVCVAIDKMAFADVVGTLAGDDTIFAATRSAAAAESVKTEILNLADK